MITDNVSIQANTGLMNSTCVKLICGTVLLCGAYNVVWCDGYWSVWKADILCWWKQETLTAGQQGKIGFASKPVYQYLCLWRALLRTEKGAEKNAKVLKMSLNVSHPSIPVYRWYVLFEKPSLIDCVDSDIICQNVYTASNLKHLFHNIYPKWIISFIQAIGLTNI